MSTNPFLGIGERGDAEYIAERFNNGEAVVLGTGRQPDGSPIVKNHAYTVTGVTENGDIIVYNPWGINRAEGLNGPEVAPGQHPDTGQPLERGELVIPKDRIGDYFEDVSSVKP